MNVMKKAVIKTGGKQYLVSEGETIKVELVKGAGKTASFEPLLTVDGDKVQIGTPIVANAKVTAEVIEADVQADKVTSIRYKAKKRVRTVRGHRQHQTILKITKIA
jgi:large subunit ribosomal protein L21